VLLSHLTVGFELADRFQLQGEALRNFSIRVWHRDSPSCLGLPWVGPSLLSKYCTTNMSWNISRAILPAIVASCAGYLVFAAMTHLGIGPAWHFPQYHIDNIYNFAEAIAYGGIGTLAGWSFIAIFRWFERLSDVVEQPIYVRTTLSGLVLGMISVYFPLTRFFGEHQIEKIVEGNFSLLFLVGLAIAKVVAISVTVVGGWRGGIIIPLFFVKHRTI
jgi:H+/Cl- antiporter ClcA